MTRSIGIIFGDVPFEQFFSVRFVIHVGFSWNPGSVIQELKVFEHSNGVKMSVVPLGGFLFSKTYGIITTGGSEEAVQSFARDAKAYINTL